MAFVLSAPVHSPRLLSRSITASNSLLLPGLSSGFLSYRGVAHVNRQQAKRSVIVRMSGGKQSNPPPVNLPAGALLGISSILAISAVGCIFELSSGHPQYGTTLTGAILAVSAPGFLFFYYATIKKGQAEAEE